MKRRALLFALSASPILIFAGLRLYPALDGLHDAPVFHFYVVTFTSFAALVSALFIASAVAGQDDIHVFFYTLAFSAIAALFMLHALATPGILIQGFNQAVGWSARLSLLLGAVLFGIGSIRWPERVERILLERRQVLWLAAGAAYLGYAAIAFGYPEPLARLSTMEPLINYSLGLLAAGLYLWSAFRVGSRLKIQSARLATILSVSFILLAQAQISMVLGPLWHLSWWLYHMLMLIAFVGSVVTIAVEYEALKEFQATRYFAALGSLIALGLALVSGEVASRVLGDPGMQAPFVAITLIVTTILYLALFFVVRRAGKTIEERTEALRREQQLRADLTRLVVHDLKNPLSAIVATLSAIRQGGSSALEARHQRLLDNALGSTAEMHRLLEDMLDFERLEGGVLTPAAEQVSLQEMIQDRTSAAEGILEQYRQSLQLRLDDHLPMVSADPDLLARVIDNLLGNAMKFSGDGGNIQIAAYASNGHAQVDILDDGPGVPPDERERIFDRYYRGRGSSRRGAGLGLSFCQMVVAAHGGSIWTDESPNGGAAFHFSLPVAE